MKKIIWFGIFLILMLASCNTVNSTPIVPEDDTDTTPIIDAAPSDARVLGDTVTTSKAVPVTGALLGAVVKVNKQSGEIVFDETKLPVGVLTNNTFAIGNILVGKASARARNGFLRKITAVKQENQQLIVTTVQGKLNEVFSAGGFRVKRHMKLSDAEYIQLSNGERQSLNQSRMTPRGLLFPVSIDFCPVNLDNNKATLNDQVCVSGSVDLELDFDFVFQCKGILCTKPYLDTNVTITQTTNLNVTGELARTINKSILIGTVPLPIITIPIVGVPLVFVPKIDITASLNGEVSAQFNYSANQTLEFTAGLELENGKFDTYSSFTKDIKTNSAIVKLAMDVEARVDAEASVLVYGIGGPTATLGGFVNFKAIFPGSPTWSLEAGLDVSIGLELSLFGLLNSDVNYEIFEKRWTIAEAVNQKPSIVIKSPLENETIELAKQTFTSGVLSGQTYFIIPTIDINTNDAEDGFGCCEVNWSIAGINRITQAGGHKITNFNVIGAPGVKTITATVTDSSNVSTTKTWNFTIKECTKTITFIATGIKSCVLVGVGTFENDGFRF